MRKQFALLSTPLAVLALAACGSSSSSSSTATSTPAATSTTSTPTTSTTPTTTTAPAASGPKISTATIAHLGTVLVNAQGRTLYLFLPDNDKKVTCVGGCASVWPPAMLAGGQTPVAAGFVKQSLLGSDPDSAGGRVITYAGWPLYTYVADSAPGTATGQAITLNGGLWYVISPTGKVIKTKP